MGKLTPYNQKNTSVTQKLKDSITQKLQTKTIRKTQINKYYEVTPQP